MSRFRRTAKAITVSQLRDEGVIELGAVESILYVRTRVKLHILHADQVPHRALDAYAIELVKTRLELGISLAEIAEGLGVSRVHALRALQAQGYTKPSLQTFS